MLKKWLGLLGLPLTETRTLTIGAADGRRRRNRRRRPARKAEESLGMVLGLVGALALGGASFYAVFALVRPA